MEIKGWNWLLFNFIGGLRISRCSLLIKIRFSGRNNSLKTAPLRLNQGVLERVGYPLGTHFFFFSFFDLFYCYESFVKVYAISFEKRIFLPYLAIKRKVRR